MTKEEIASHVNDYLQHRIANSKDPFDIRYYWFRPEYEEQVHEKWKHLYEKLEDNNIKAMINIDNTTIR